MIDVSVRSNIADAAARLSAFDQRQLPYAVSRALTATARDAQSAVVKAMPSAFDRPTPYTLGSTVVLPASKASLEAVVKLKDTASRGTPAAKYLMPQIAGGTRRVKRIERLFAGKGIVPNGMTVVPARGVRRDAYGGVSRATFGEILRKLQAAEAVAAKRAAGGKVRKARKTANPQATYFVTKPGAKRPGIYQRFDFAQGRAIRPVLLFKTPPRYRQAFDFGGISVSAIKSRFDVNLRDAIQQALATAR